MKAYIVLACSALTLTSLSPVSAASIANEIWLDGIIAVVNNNVILQSDLDKSVQLFSSRAGERGQSVADTVNFRRQVLAHLVSQQVQLQEAEVTGIRVSDSQLNGQMRNIARNSGQTLSQFREGITSSGGDYRRVRQEVHTELVVRRLYERQVLERIRVSEQEIEDYLTRQAKSDEQQIEYALQRILIGISEGANADEIEQANELASSLVAQLREGADFGALAIQYSTAAEALNGGDIGKMIPADMPGVYADAVAGKPVGAISDPVRTTNGFHVLRIADKAGQQRHWVRQSRVRHILLTTSAIRGEDATRDELTNLRKRIELGDSFAEIAQAHSQDSISVAAGGELQWLSPGDMPRVFEDVVNRLEVNQISAPFRSPWGWHIIELLEQREEDLTEKLLEVNAREALRSRKAREQEELWRRRLLAEAYIEYRVDELAPQRSSDKL